MGGSIGRAAVLGGTTVLLALSQIQWICGFKNNSVLSLLLNSKLFTIISVSGSILAVIVCALGAGEDC